MGFNLNFAPVADVDSNPKNPVVTPFLLKKDAEAHAMRSNGKLATYAEALGQAVPPVAVATAGK